MVVTMSGADGRDALLSELTNSLADAGTDPSAFRHALQTADSALTARFRDGASATDLVRLRAAIIDRLIVTLWQRASGDLRDLCSVVAVGGYGRGELHPYSDIDILILVRDGPSGPAQERLSDFLTKLWDIGLEIGHSVRTVDDCRQQAEADLSTATSMMEARLIHGSQDLFDRMEKRLSPTAIWPSTQFFAAKRKEQVARHHRYDDTAYKLEPNVKGSPGGLRDIQLVGWVAKRHFDASTLHELVDHAFLTSGQLQRLLDGQEFLWRVRFGLHVLTGRREDRLLFDHQRKLAELLGYEDASYTLGVEQLMQRYYRTVMELSRLNEILLQQFEEAILMDPNAEPRTVNARFEIKNGYLQTANDRVFADDPSALLEVFLLLQQHPHVRGVSAYTVSLIKRSLHLIDEGFRQNPRNHRLFLTIIRAPAGVTHELRRMNRYGVLGLYIPAFGRIVGRMQYDLFHAYTVDEHSLFVVSNLRRFALERFDREYPECSRIMQSLEKPEIVYLSGLFHDIAKGRGGDHSELGAIDAEAFCREHGMSAADAETVAWLVRNHLILSMTAQKKDLGDPDVINEFATIVAERTRLDYLYLLTVADVRATNPRLWNSWKATLFGDLYSLTRRALRSLESPIDRAQLVEETGHAARELSRAEGVGDGQLDEVWRVFTEDYFLRYRPAEIAWHTSLLVANGTEPSHGLLDVRRQPSGDGIEAVLYTPRERRTFALATALLAELGTTIVDARIVPLANGYSLDTYIFMETDPRVEIDSSRLGKIRESLTHVLTANDDTGIKVTRRAPRQVRMFTTRTSVSFSRDEANKRTVMEIVSADRPGLLSTVGEVFIEQDVNIDTAKILTIGEKAEDVFYVVELDDTPLSLERCRELETRIVEALDATG